jgi:glycine/D-amino acid oxidase-like deaminating enzyme
LNRADIAVIGGGIVGAAAAASLSAGGMVVDWFEATAVGAGASGRNSGIIQRPFDPQLAALHDGTLARYRELEAIATAPAGLMLITRDAEAIARVAAAVAVATPSLQPQVLAPSDARALAPGLAPDVQGCLLATGWPVPPDRLTRVLGEQAVALGARLRVGRTARPVWRRGRVVGLAVDGRLERIERVLVAAGPWTPGVLDPTGAWRPIRAVWGLVAEIRLATPPTVALEEAEISSALAPTARGAPARAHQIAFSLVTSGSTSTAGSTFLSRKPGPATWLPRVLGHGADLMPLIRGLDVVSSRACARPVSVDGLPLLGPMPGIEGLYVAAGHGAWGISTGPGSATLVADLILGRRPKIPVAFDPGRFGSLAPTSAIVTDH